MARRQMITHDRIKRSSVARELPAGISPPVRCQVLAWQVLGDQAGIERMCNTIKDWNEIYGEAQAILGDLLPADSELIDWLASSTLPQADAEPETP
jgi:hypothetical protein